MAGAEQAWATLHLPLLLFTVIGGAETALGALRRLITHEAATGGESAWTEQDLAQVRQYLSRGCVCTGGGLGLTAEFGLNRGAVSAARGDGMTALFQLSAEEPHPEFGGGLFCLLQMPHHFRTEAHLQATCARLNAEEMAVEDGPPHFGAWCVGRLGDNLAYTSFLPNALHQCGGIAANVSFWAMHRAQWAHSALASLGAEH